MSNEITPYQVFFHVLRHHRKLVLAFVFFTLSSLLLEGFGVTVLISSFRENVTGFDLGRLSVLTGLQTMLETFSMQEKVRFISIALVTFICFAAATRHMTLLLSLRLQVEMERDVRSAVAEKIYELTQKYFDKQSFGKMSSLASYEVSRASRVPAAILAMCGVSTIVVLYSAIMLVISVKLTLVAIALLAVMTIASRVVFPTRRVMEYGREVVSSRQQMHATVSENISLVKLTHLYNKEPESLAKIADANRVFLDCLYRIQKSILITKPATTIFAAVALGVLLVCGSFLTDTSSGTWLQQTSVFILIVMRLLTPAVDLNRAHADFIAAYPSLLEVTRFLNNENTIRDSSNRKSLEVFDSSISIKDVTFYYEDQTAPALNRVSLEIPKGKVTAIVGRSGCGKSTLINLLAGLYEPDSGCILVDNQDLREIDWSSWRNKLAIVSQETLLFHATILENLKFGNPTATDEAAMQAAHLAHLDHFIQSLPEGYQTIIGDNGILLSGGQRQRLSIARAILADTEIILLDEATSALDSETELVIQNAIEKFSGARTVLICAHRLSTIHKAHQIIVLSEGSVVEQGSHQQLLADGNIYARLVRMQRINYDENANRFDGIAEHH